jgi:hypothetical protein
MHGGPCGSAVTAHREPPVPPTERPRARKECRPLRSAMTCRTCPAGGAADLPGGAVAAVDLVAAAVASACRHRHLRDRPGAPKGPHAGATLPSFSGGAGDEATTKRSVSERPRAARASRRGACGQPQTW